mmetsp:Transcript_4692/g.13360  ORF Transcript_4692/g.13360 Transcript_4692/m.13360 type:complete len:442 (-) Transcript_4692:422-1747(-)
MMKSRRPLACLAPAGANGVDPLRDDGARAPAAGVAACAALLDEAVPLARLAVSHEDEVQHLLDRHARVRRLAVVYAVGKDHGGVLDEQRLAQELNPVAALGLVHGREAEGPAHRQRVVRLLLAEHHGVLHVRVAPLRPDVPARTVVQVEVADAHVEPRAERLQVDGSAAVADPRVQGRAARGVPAVVPGEGPLLHGDALVAEPRDDLEPLRIVAVPEHPEVLAVLLQDAREDLVRQGEDLADDVAERADGQVQPVDLEYNLTPLVDDPPRAEVQALRPAAHVRDAHVVQPLQHEVGPQPVSPQNRLRARIRAHQGDHPELLVEDGILRVERGGCDAQSPRSPRLAALVVLFVRRKPIALGRPVLERCYIRYVCTGYEAVLLLQGSTDLVERDAALGQRGDAGVKRRNHDGLRARAKHAREVPRRLEPQPLLLGGEGLGLGG